MINTIAKILDILISVFKLQDLVDKIKLKFNKDHIVNKIVNDELENKNNTRFSDAVRKQKQEKINMIKTILISFLLICAGCELFHNSQNTIPPDILDMYDLNSLTASDKTFRICHTNKITVYDGDIKTNLFFSSEWFVVNKDLLKTFNENQNLIIQKNKEYGRTIMILCSVGIIVLAFFLFILRKNNG